MSVSVRDIARICPVCLLERVKNSFSDCQKCLGIFFNFGWLFGGKKQNFFKQTIF